ncbi:MAG: hypothetical protein Q7O66_09305 [Dehalococcoidia bacterium]|nr:hypothetical protein [Dehalococcoidia bacterium]
MTLDLYGPINPPPSGEKIAAADQGDNWGQKQLALVSTVAGTYTLIITNWDPNGRPVQFSMTASGPSGRSGPAFTFLSSGS